MLQVLPMEIFINKVDFIKGLPFIADKGYDSISVIQKILDIGLILAVKIKETLRVKIKHPLRQLSKENWLKYGKKRYRIESLFGNIKNKANSVFRVKIEDIAKKLAIAWAILWNFYMILICVFLFILTVLILKRIIFDFWNTLLFGIATLNGVVLISYIRQLLQEGLDINKAIEKATRLRLRPILITATAASLGLIPILLTSDIGSETQKPIATVVIGGIFTSTMLTLLILPIVYKTFYRVGLKNA
jgi:multidrug efflux pump subunit AcrB